MGWQFCSKDPYKHDKVVRHLWRAFRAIPMLQITADLDVLQVLIRESDGFRLLGSLADLCCEGSAKDTLTEVLSKRAPEIFVASQEGKSVSTIIKNKRGVSAVLGIAGISSSVGFDAAKELIVSLPEQRLVRVPEVQLKGLMKDFELDVETIGQFLPRAQEFHLWVVNEVVFCPSIRVEAVGSISAGGDATTPITPVTPELKLGLHLTKSSERLFELKGDQISGTDPPAYKSIPVAFRGWKYTFNRLGFKVDRPLEHTKYQPDGDHGAEVDKTKDDEPSRDVHMVDFVNNGYFPKFFDPTTGELPEEEESEDDDSDDDDTDDITEAGS